MGRRGGSPSGHKPRTLHHPRCPPPSYPPDPCHKHNQPPSPPWPHRITQPHTLSASLPRTQTWRVSFLTSGPRWSLVWRPVCVCLASNGPFKCRIFTAQRAILRDSARTSLNMLQLHYPEGTYPYYHHDATLTGNELRRCAAALG